MVKKKVIVGEGKPFEIVFESEESFQSFLTSLRGGGAIKEVTANEVVNASAPKPTFKASFVRNDVSIDVCKAYGHKEATIEFNSLEEKHKFIEKVKNKDESALDQLEDESDLLLDDWGVNDYDCWGEWELD